MSLAEADMGLTMMAFQQSGQLGPQPGDETMLVRFVMQTLEDTRASEEAGRPIFKDVPFVEIMAPGDREIFSELANDDHKTRWPKQWEAFETRQNQDVVEGTPLSEWPGIARSTAEELKFFNIHTLEQLANVNDSNVQNFQGLGTLREKAKRYMSYAGVQAEANAAIELENRLQEMERQLREQAETIRTQEAIIERATASQAQPQAVVEAPELPPTSQDAAPQEETGRRRAAP